MSGGRYEGQGGDQEELGRTNGERRLNPGQEVQQNCDFREASVGCKFVYGHGGGGGGGMLQDDICTKTR